MLSETDLRELLSFSTSHLVLSVYLNTEPSEGNADAHKLRLRNMLKDIYLPQDVSAIEQYFNLEYPWTGRAVALFSCAADGFFRAYPLAVPVHSLVHVGDRPSVKPLAALLDNYGGYGVVLVDKQGARLFFFHLGELREQEGIMGEAVKRTKYGGASAVPGRRGGTAGQTHYVDEVVDRNLKEAAEFAIRFFEENRVRRILIGGTEDTVAAFRACLPKAWQSLVMGAFGMSMTASHTEVLNRALQIGMEAETLREAHLVQNLMTAAAKGAGGVTGLAGTLDAVNQRNVQTLLILEGYRAAAFRCKACGLLNTNRDQPCPVCGGETEHLWDGVDTAVNAVLRSGGEVEVLRSNPQLEQAGKIGALLRYQA